MIEYHVSPGEIVRFKLSGAIDVNLVAFQDEGGVRISACDSDGNKRACLIVPNGLLCGWKPDEMEA